MNYLHTNIILRLRIERLKTWVLLQVEVNTAKYLEGTEVATNWKDFIKSGLITIKQMCKV